MSLVKKTIESGVATVTLCRPEKRNALNRELLQQFAKAIQESLDQPQTRVLVIKAEGTVFCAGMDLAEMEARSESQGSDQEWLKDAQDYCELLVSLYSAAVPTVAVVQGPVLAGGVGIALACDFVIAADDAFFSLPEPQRGITAAMVTPLLVHRIGAGRAGQLLLSGARQTAQDATLSGMVYQAVAQEKLPKSVQALTDSILLGSAEALAITKRHLDEVSGKDLVSKLRQSIEISAEARSSQDAREGLAAFLEKRKPNWQNG